MIAFLRGCVLSKQPNLLVVDVQGVGYQVHVPLSTYYGIGDEGADVALHVHTHVREDALHLFGFATTIEQELFERLIAIGGIGPKLAIAVLSGIGPSELIKAVRHGDLARLTGIPGVGRKTAERMILELKDRLAHVSLAPGADGRPADAPGERLRDDLLSALQNLGYHRPLAEKAIDTMLSSATEPSFEDGLKSALRELMR
jgi:holliday junction DNA helicase RuvA